MIWADDEFEDDGKQHQRKMGRVPRAYEDYIKESNRRIENWNTELQKHPTGSKKRQRLRNKITALRSRMKLKTENKNHSRTIWTLQKQVIQMAQFVEIELNNDPNAAKYRDNILKKIKEAHDQD